MKKYAHVYFVFQTPPSLTFAQIPQKIILMSNNCKTSLKVWWLVHLWFLRLISTAWEAHLLPLVSREETPQDRSPNIVLCTTCSWSLLQGWRDGLGYWGYLAVREPGTGRLAAPILAQALVLLLFLGEDRIYIFFFPLSILISYSLKSILSDIPKALPACFLVPCAWNILFPSFIPKVMFVLDSEVCFLHAIERWILSSNSHLNLYLLIGYLRPFLLRFINEQFLLIHIILLLWYGLCPSFLMFWDYLLLVPSWMQSVLRLKIFFFPSLELCQ